MARIAILVKFIVSSNKSAYVEKLEASNTTSLSLSSIFSISSILFSLFICTTLYFWFSLSIASTPEIDTLTFSSKSVGLYSFSFESNFISYAILYVISLFKTSFSASLVFSSLATSTVRIASAGMYPSTVMFLSSIICSRCLLYNSCPFFSFSSYLAITFNFCSSISVAVKYSLSPGFFSIWTCFVVSKFVSVLLVSSTTVFICASSSMFISLLTAFSVAVVSSLCPSFLRAT